MIRTIQSHVFIDGPNIDMVLGKDVLGRFPRRFERPRWDRVRDFCHTELGCARPTFVLNGNRFSLGNPELLGFRRVLREFGYEVQCPRRGDEDPVDEYIKERVQTIAKTSPGCEVAVMSHDNGYAAELKSILSWGGKVSVIGFPEEMSPRLVRLREYGANIIDLEHHVGGFDIRLGRPVLNWRD
ncbi:MAG: hypothetical protein R3C10_11815 [Pirellulales bacterium]